MRAGRALDERSELFVETGYAKDTCAGIDSRFGGEAGVARKLSITEPHLLSVEAAFGLAREVRLPKKTAKDFATGRAGLSYTYVISKTAGFQDRSDVTLNPSDRKDWRWTNVAALAAALSSRFSIKVSHTLSRLNTPPTGKKKSDTAVAAALVAKF